MKGILHAVLALACISTVVAQLPDSSTPVVLNGTLHMGLVGMGGETTGIELYYTDTQGRQRTIEVIVSEKTSGAKLIKDGALVSITGTTVTHTYAERGDVRQLIASDIKLDNAPKGTSWEVGEVAHMDSVAYDPGGWAVPPTPSPEEPNFEHNYASVRVYYCTDRAKYGDDPEKPGDLFTGLRGSDLTYGYGVVSIPRDHRLGELEAPSVFRFEFHTDPEKHVVLLSAIEEPKEAFFLDVRNRLGAAHGKNVLIFIHGFNVTFEDAARRTAQMAYDLGFDGAPIFFSWPSKGNLSGYLADETDIEWAEPHLESFLFDVLSRTNADNIFLIAHSMGNRGLAKAFTQIAISHPEMARRIRGVVLAAPDIDAGVFKEQIVPRIQQAGIFTTLYCSSRDEALVASHTVHQYPRAGESGAGLIVAKGLETVDASEIDTSLLGHSYYGDNRSIISDLFYIVREGRSASQRFSLTQVIVPGGQYWKFVP
jgi:esterase/lipase superfamily enzyme